MENKRSTIRDVAGKAGVSVTTVSQILNGNGERFTPKTVRRVLSAKKELNYEPDYFARRMVMKQSKMIGVLVPDITNPFFNELVRGIEDVLYRDGFITMLCNADLSPVKEDEYLKVLSHRGVDGFIIASSSISNKSLNEHLTQEGRPFIVLDQKKADGISDAVLTDDFSGGKQAAQHLKDNGHQHVAVVIPQNSTDNIKQRLAGFYDVYNQEQVTVIETSLSKMGGENAVPKIIKTEATAIFAINDEMALGIYRGMSKAKKKIPEDYSVVGYDNIDMCEYVTPSLTTIAQPIFGLGKTTAKMLIDRIQNQDKEWEEQLLPVHLVQRNSTIQLNS